MSSSTISASARPWQFAIDVGGTFTDCVGISPDGRVLTFKTLSSGRTKGTIGRVFDRQIVEDPLRTRDPEGFWNGARLFVEGGPEAGIVIEDFHAGGGRLRLAESLPVAAVAGSPYEIVTGDEAPVLGIRHLLGLRSGDPFPPCEVKLGTTRGTNALLERKGARVGLVTTRGFGDILIIGDQARPRLFDLDIRKPEPLFTAVSEVDERLAADGAVLVAPSLDAVRSQLEGLRSQGIESLAVALLHSYRNPVHEQLVAKAAEGLGFREVVLSSAVSPTIKVVPRGESAVVDAYLNPILRLYVARISRQLGLSASDLSSEAAEDSGDSLSLVEQYETFRESKGLRLTCDERQVVETIERLDPSFEAEGLVQLLDEQSPAGTISRATVYQTLNQLVEAGLFRIVSGSLHPDRLERVPVAAGSEERGSPVSMQVMTSGGGLVAAGDFTGRDSILSGPAGGVIGSSQTAARAGFPRSIGFDMGGTSTDVSRYDGRFELEYESRKAGVRIASPMLAIETVAAGGGSICRFDGVKLTVGPASAGSDPGPACYGRGGPLTITDCNLAVGRLVEEQFPFRLDRDAVEHRLAEILGEVAAKTGRILSREELASGFLDIANAHMARAIRRISVGRGYDPADYVLSVFGGAGAQHACSLASQLGMTRIVVHPLAGALSAYGIACADVVRHATATLLRPLGEIRPTELAALFDRLEREAADGLSMETASGAGTIAFQRSLDLRYLGVESSLSIPQPAGGDYGEAYAAAHEREFGYRRPGRPIEAVAARVEARVRQPAPPAPDLPNRWEPGGPPRRVFVDGAWIECPSFRRGDHGSHARVDGPALLSESMTTIVVDPGFEASILDHGEGRGSILLQRLGEARRERIANDETPDPIQLEIFNNLFASIAEQMGETLRRTSVSTNVKERLDYSCAVFDSSGDLVVNAPHIPVHLGAMAETVRNVLADNPDLGPGDVVLTNDPFRGGSHLPDLTVVTPVFDPDGKDLLFVVASRAHHAEIGGIVPGSMPPFSRTLAEEGVLIRNFRIVRRGVFQEETLRALLGDPAASFEAALPFPAPAYPSRRPDDNVADLSAQVAANQTGVLLLHRLVKERTLEQVQRYMRFIRDAAAAKVRQALAAIPDGEFHCTDFLDDGSPIAVTVRVAADAATVDFAGTGPVLASNLNANRAIVTAAVLYVFRTLINEDIPLNGGVLEPVTIVLPECLLNPPAHDDPARCAAIVGGNVETSQRVVDVLLQALGAAACSQGTMNNLTFGDATFGYYETICGGSGATPRGAGADAVQTHMTNTRLTDVELLEQRYPVRVREFSIRRGSGGAGRHPGGAGVVRDIEFLKTMTVSILSQRRGRNAPRGLSGGGPGATGRNTLERIGGERTDLGPAAQVSVGKGDRIIVETPGGGGWGFQPPESEQTPSPPKESLLHAGD